MSGANELGRRSPCPTRTVIDRRYVSSIPGDIIEKTISDYKRDGGLVWLRRERDNLPERHFPVKLRQALRKT